MKLRRVMAAAATTAVIAPLALLSAPAAFATDPAPTGTETTTAPATPGATETETAGTTPPAATPTTTPPTSTTPAGTPTSTPPATSPAPSTTPPGESETPDPEPSVCEDTKVDVSITGLPGKIAVGTGWHKFSLNVLNSSDSTLQDLDFLAGASSDVDGTDLFKSKQVQLQAWNPDAKVWENLDEEGYAVGFVGYTDELKPDYEVHVPLRINVKSTAPVGAGFSLGATIYGDDDAECTGFGEVAYKFRIVAAGTDTNDTKPQEGGKAPVSDRTPDKANTPQVTGNLAETGSSSALPTIGLVGGVALAAGVGAVVVARRRKAGSDA
ncbi:LAETG motif-containing sortase-dependent surface protein [Streptomyces sp. NPDC017991]|uniref:LAETG motif-containing sortase-dependent surface protein n=1 Tax=Streptomyces sp. NPDC017991 TaxID=3365026 RepID=UPI0037921AB1